MTDPFASAYQTATGQPDPFATTGNDPFGSDPFGTPAPKRPKGPNVESLKGRLLMFTPKSISPVQKEMNGVTTTVNRCVADVVVLDGPFPIQHIDGITKEATGTTFEDREYEDMWIDNVGLVNAMRLAVSGKAAPRVLGRLGRVKNPTPGRAPIWVLADPTDEDKVRARQYLAQSALS